MHVAKGKSQLNQHLKTLLSKNKTIGFVPTMGALHFGHLHLIKQSVSQNDISICSIYVNPTQFNDPIDFEKYPRNSVKDIEFLKGVGLDIVYLPDYDELYPSEKERLIDYTDNQLFSVFEGEFRPGHFLGVVTVVMRLFEHVNPSKAYFGLKDYQQYLVIKRATPKFFKAIEIIGVPTVRNENGLALSSRNKRLNNEQLELSVAIPKALRHLEQSRGTVDMEIAINESKELIRAAGLKLDYLDVCDKTDLKRRKIWGDENENVALCAAFMGQVRLIDNRIF